MKLSSYLDDKLVFFNVTGDTMSEAIDNLLDEAAVVNKKIAERKNEIKYTVKKRESEVSTAMGYGIAIPHARIENFNDFIVMVGVMKKPFDAKIGLTGREDKVELLFMILSDVLKNKNMLKVMSGISKLAMKQTEIINQIKKETNPVKIINMIEQSKVEVGQRITAEDVLRPDILPVTPETTLEEVAKRLIIEGIAGLPVVDRNGNFLGEITERELISFGMPKYTSIMDDLSFMTVGEPFEEYLVNEKTTTIEEIYRTYDLNTVDREAPIMEISFIMVNKGATRLYVVENGKYYGMILRSDIIKKVLHI